MSKRKSTFQTAAARLRRQIAQKQAKIQNWEQRLAVTTNPRSQASLRAHITRARNDISALEAKARRLEERTRR